MLPFLPIPNGVLILFVVAIVASLVLTRTAFGRYTFALGSNEEAVRLSGVNTDLWKIMVYTVAGGICGIAGLLIASRLNSAQPALGQGYELDAIAAVVIGGTSLTRRPRHHSRHDHRRPHHQRAGQWPAHPLGRPGMADGRDRLIIILAVYADILRRRRT